MTRLENNRNAIDKTNYPLEGLGRHVDREPTLEVLAVEDESKVVRLIRKNLVTFPEAGSVLAATFRRLEHLGKIYQAEGSRFFVLRDLSVHHFIGAVGLGPLAGLPPSEGVGEIRDMVIDAPYRCRGFGRKLVEACLNAAREIGYKRIYLETTPQMQDAQKLFTSFGFQPVTQKAIRPKVVQHEPLPCYFVMDI